MDSKLVEYSKTQTDSPAVKEISDPSYSISRLGLEDQAIRLAKCADNCKSTNLITSSDGNLLTDLSDEDLDQIQTSPSLLIERLNHSKQSRPQVKLI